MNLSDVTEVVTSSAPSLGSVITWILAGIGAVGGVLGFLFSRRTGKESNDIDRFEALYGAQEKRIDDLRDELAGVKTELETVKRQYTSQGEILRRIKRVISDWFRDISARWAQLTDEPMPMPSDEDLDLLEITFTVPRTAPKPSAPV